MAPDSSSEPNDAIVRDPALFQQILDNQSIELSLRQREMDLREREIENSHEYAVKLLDAQLVDRDREREQNKASMGSGCLIIAFFLLILAGGIAYALYLNKDALVMETIKTIGLFAGGGVGGYGLKAIKDEGKSKPE